jgi:hypothetical protein
MYLFWGCAVFLLLDSLWPTIVLLLTVSVLYSAIAPWIAFGMCPVVLFGLCVASSVRVMPAYKFGPSGFVRRSLVFCDFTYLCSLSLHPHPSKGTP